MLARAIESGAGIDVLEKLMALQERWEANNARKAFDAAISAAKAEMPILAKNKLVDFVGPSGKRTTYKHETLDEVVRTIQPIMAKHGLDTRFRTASAPGFLTVVCHVSHVDGYSEDNTLTAPVDLSGNKNAIQGIGSVQTYLQRYTLKAALGLAASDDDDGRAAGGGSVVSNAEADQLRALLTETRSNLDAFLKYFHAPSVSDVPAARFEEAVRMLQTKKQTMGEQR